MDKFIVLIFWFLTISSGYCQFNSGEIIYHVNYTSLYDEEQLNTATKKDLNNFQKSTEELEFTLKFLRQYYRV